MDRVSDRPIKRTPVQSSFKTQRVLLLLTLVVFLIAISQLLMKLEIQNLEQSQEKPHKQAPEYLLTIVFRTTEDSDYAVVADSIASIVSDFPYMPVLVVCETSPYPAINLTNDVYKNVKVLPRNSDIGTEVESPYKPNSIMALIVPDSIRLNAYIMLAIKLKIEMGAHENIEAIQVGSSNLTSQSILWDGNWKVYYINTKLKYISDAVVGEHAILIDWKTLTSMPDAFQLPFPESLYLHASMKNETVTISLPCVFQSGKQVLKSETDEKKASAGKLKHLRKHRIKFYKKYDIKSVRRNGVDEYYGCNEKTQRCFPPVMGKPSYVLRHKTTPDCCLWNMEKVAVHVLQVLQYADVKCWLESMSLVGAATSGTLTSYADHVELGIYADDIHRVEYLQRGGTDTNGYVWKRAAEGHYYVVSLSAINNNNVLILPFKSRDGIMWPYDWVLPHQRDFPERHLNPLKKIRFGKKMFPAPNDEFIFLDHKFGVTNATGLYLTHGPDFLYP